MKQQELYVINHCDIWHTYASFRFIGVVDADNLDKALRKIKREQGYSDQDMEDYINVECVYCNELDI